MIVYPIMKEWTKVFKALGNENRLKILRLLTKKRELPVKAIGEYIGMGIKSTSKHLIILANLNMLQSQGKMGSVWYALHPSIRPEVHHIIHRFLK